MDTMMPTQREPCIEGNIAPSLIARQFYQGDPWLLLVNDRLRLDNFWNMALFFVISLLYNFSVTTIFLKDYHPTTSLFDALHLILLSVAFTSFYGIYMLLPTLMANTIDTLQANGVIGAYRHHGATPVSYESFVKQLLARANSWWWLALIALITVLSWVQWVVLRHPPFSLFWLILGFLVGILPGIYMICFILVRVVLLLVFINRLFFLFAIHVKLLHADGSGGLGSLSHILWICVGMMLALVLAVLATPQRLTSPEIILIGACYLICIVSLSIGWLALPHYRMLQARTELLQPLTDEYEQALKDTLPSISGDTATLVAGTERLSTLQDRYKLLRDAFPVWPIEIIQMRRLGVALFLPALLALLPALLGWLTK